MMKQRRRMLSAVNQADKTNYLGTLTPTLRGGYFGTNGAFVSDGQYYVCSESYFEVKPSTTYTSEINLTYYNSGKIYDAIIYQIAVYDANQNFISFLWNGTTDRLYKRIFTTPANGKYIRLGYCKTYLTGFYKSLITWYACGLYKGTKSYLSEEI